MADTKYSRQRGFTLLAAGLSAIAMFGMAGLAIDLGRVYITKNEATTYADAAAISAAMQLDGSAASLTNADNAVAASVNKWNFGTTAFTGTVTEYSADGATGWATSATAVAANMRYVRVTATVNNVALFLLPVTGTANAAIVKASAVAGQELLGLSAPVRNGVFPYSPISHAMGSTVEEVALSDPTGNFGFIVGEQYSLKWPSNPEVGAAAANKAPCSGDNNQTAINRQTGAVSEVGEIELNASSSIYEEIVGDTGQINVLLNQSVNPTTGTKNHEVDAFNERISQDSDRTSTSYQTYTGNGRRLITVIVNSGYSDESGVALPANQQAIGVGFAQFLLAPTYTKQGGGNNAWCAIYVGSNPTYGTGGNSGGGSTNGAGIGFIRLTQ